MSSHVQDFRQRFRAVLVEATVKLDEVLKKIGRAVDDSKPYWEARKVARRVHVHTPTCTHTEYSQAGLTLKLTDTNGEFTEDY